MRVIMKVHIFCNMRPSCYAILSRVRTYSTKNNLHARAVPVPGPAHDKRYPKIVWKDQQLGIIQAIERGESVFITGSAGTGKTMLIQHLIKLLVKIHGKKRVGVTASTGVAACALRAQTLQSFAGVGIADADVETLLSRVLDNRMISKRWKNAMALVIDEISMVDKTLFEKFEYIARKVRCGNEESKPWGGLQLVVSGDFFQLPPVDVESQDVHFAFEADCWENSFQLKVSLETVFRQSELEYIKLLEGIRVGEIDETGLSLLQQCCQKELDKTVVRLFPRNRDVDRVNKTRLRNLKEEIVTYNAFDCASQEHWKRRLNHVIAQVNLELCKGARVMLIWNLNVQQKLVNGATGTVIGFEESRIDDVKRICCYDGGTVLPVVKFDCGREEVVKPVEWEVVVDDKVVASRRQVPLMLAWAMSVHKSQGMTLEKLHTDLSQAFGCGMVYVALSRLRSLEGLSMSGFDGEKIKAHPKVIEYYKKCF